MTELKSVAALTVVYSLALSFIVLFACTWSPRVAAMATFCIASVVVYFVAFMTLQGWRLGIIEAVCVQVIVGLSVDYISHAAVAYVSTREKFMTREERALASVRAVGGAVTAGWFSSVAAASCLFGCTILFFSKFAAFVATLTTSFAAPSSCFPSPSPRSVPPLSATGRSRRRFARDLRVTNHGRIVTSRRVECPRRRGVLAQK